MKITLIICSCCMIFALALIGKNAIKMCQMLHSETVYLPDSQTSWHYKDNAGLTAHNGKKYLPDCLEKFKVELAKPEVDSRDWDHIGPCEFQLLSCPKDRSCKFPPIPDPNNPGFAIPLPNDGSSSEAQAK